MTGKLFFAAFLRLAIFCSFSIVCLSVFVWLVPNSIAISSPSTKKDKHTVEEFSVTLGWLPSLNVLQTLVFIYLTHRLINNLCSLMTRFPRLASGFFSIHLGLLPGLLPGR